MTKPIAQALVTGGAGFIGSHLVDALLRQGTRVTVIDNLTTGKMENLREAWADVDFHEGDIRDRGLLRKLMDGAAVVFHQAAVVSVPLSVAQPLASAEVNEMGTLAVLETARQAGCRRVVLASSSAVYGDDPQLPKHEAMGLRPLSPYAVQKMVGETYAGLYGTLYGLETASLRYFNVFGPRQDPSSPYSGVISIFMDRAVAGRPPVIYGDGEQTRDFIYVADAVAANLKAATSEEAPGHTFNVGTGRTITINRLWQSVAGLAGHAVAPEYQAAREGDIRHSVADIEAARRHLGFAPQVGFEEGLARTHAWYRTR
jgi:nucleoside-diphosphate-sugar epimerase